MFFADLGNDFFEQKARVGIAERIIFKAAVGAVLLSLRRAGLLRGSRAGLVAIGGTNTERGGRNHQNAKER